MNKSCLLFFRKPPEPSSNRARSREDKAVPVPPVDVFGVFCAKCFASLWYSSEFGVLSCILKMRISDVLENCFKLLINAIR